MNDSTQDDDFEMPDELRALHEELLSIQYEERPSFGPELRAELARAWADGPVRKPVAIRRHVTAAALAALLVGGASVPSARASLIRLIGQIGPEPVALQSPPIQVVRPAVAAAPEREAEPEPESVPEAVPVAMVDLPAEESLAPEIDPGPVLIAPEMIDRERSRRLLQAAYPRHLQRQAVGGVVWVRLWVDDRGMAGRPSLLHSSGVELLDRVAVRVAPDFMFQPALEDGSPVGRWIEFPVLFEPDSSLVENPLPPVTDPLSLPVVPRVDEWQLRDPLSVGHLPPVNQISGHEPAARGRAASALGEAIEGDESILQAFGPTSAILAAEPPVGSDPIGWRAVVGDALSRSIEDGRHNPAAMLALGRIRARQGLRTDARSLFEGGLRLAIDQADAGVDVSDWVVAELHYERSAILRANWLGSRDVGRVRADAFPTGTCRQASSTGGAATGYASADRLVAWNFLCPTEASRVFDRGFEASSRGAEQELALMMGSLRAAAEAFPAHVGANTDLLLTLVDAKRWDDVLVGARRFTRVSGGHPNGLLLAALALHRLDRTVEAEPLFEAALARMDQPLADQLSYVGYLLEGSELTWYRRAASDERRDWEHDFWAERDHRPDTEVNERWVEHMARTTVASFRFGSVFGDAPEVWVRFGGPTTIHVVEDGSGRLTEFWDYGSGPDITFVRWKSSKRTDLTPEGRAYVDDLGNIFPPQ